MRVASAARRGAATRVEVTLLTAVPAGSCASCRCSPGDITPMFHGSERSVGAVMSQPGTTERNVLILGSPAPCPLPVAPRFPVYSGPHRPQIDPSLPRNRPQIDPRTVPNQPETDPRPAPTRIDHRSTRDRPQHHPKSTKFMSPATPRAVVNKREPTCDVVSFDVPPDHPLRGPFEPRLYI